MQLLRDLPDKNDTIVTLHGYLRIIPADICEMLEIYNGHPGLINYYPELKGLDPQKRAWENRHRYKWMGSVVHQVTPKLDDGRIITYSAYPMKSVKTEADLFRCLKETSKDAWIEFFDEVVECE